MILILQYAAGLTRGCRLGVRAMAAAGGRQFLDIGTGLRSTAPAGSAASPRPAARAPAGGTVLVTVTLCLARLIAADLIR